MSEPDSNGRFLRSVANFFLRPSLRYSVAFLTAIGFFTGIIFWGGFNTAIEATNSLEFCISCHEMRDNVYQEYKKTIHFSNPVGVRAICSDCHVPHDWGHKMLRKMQASFEVWGHLTGYVDTPEKFEAHRLELASHEWARMKSTDSRECRNCHSLESMDLAAQKPSARTSHEGAKTDGQTCIDCHKGIAHKKPVDPNAKAEEPDFNDIH
jgi:cytochrome c-type protein NapC